MTEREDFEDWDSESQEWRSLQGGQMSHVHGVLTQPTVEPADWDCPTCVFYADAERKHRESGEVMLEAIGCAGCDSSILATKTIVGVSLTGHVWQNELCEISWGAAVDASEGVTPAECVCERCGL